MTKPYQRPSADEPAWWFICAGGEIVLDDDHQPPHGRAEELPLPTLDEYQIIWLGEVRERSCYLVLADYGDDAFAALGEFQSLRPLIEKHDEEMFSMASRAKQITEFVSTHRFCGRCGARMQAVDWELAMQCHTCKHRCYPRISPCIIVAIRKGKKILLARGERHRPDSIRYWRALLSQAKPLNRRWQGKSWKSLASKSKTFSMSAASHGHSLIRS